MALKSFADQINLFKGMKKNFIFKDDKGNEHVSTTKLIEVFKVMFSVKTLRTKLYHNKPVMYLFKDGVFVEEVYSYFKECCYEMFGSALGSGSVNEAISNMQSLSFVDDDFFEKIDPYLINLKNCILDVRAKKVIDQHPDYRFTTRIDVNYDPDAKYDFMTDFVNEIVDEVDAKILQELFGYCLLRNYIFQKAFLLYGEGANGKDTLLYVLRQLLGIKNYSSINLIAISNDRFATYNLYRKYANISGETPRKSMDTTDTLKSLCGGSSIPGQRKFGDVFNFENYAKLIFSCNIIPETMDKTFAFWRRWILIHFPNKFVGSNDKKKLKYDLTTDERMSGILNYALDGLYRLLEQMGFSEKLSDEEVQKIWDEQSNSTRAFVYNCIEEGDELANNQILIAYANYCSKNNLPFENPNNFWKEFKKLLEELYPIAKDIHQKNNGTYYRIGIRLCPD